MISFFAQQHQQYANKTSTANIGGINCSNNRLSNNTTLAHEAAALKKQWTAIAAIMQSLPLHISLMWPDWPTNLDTRADAQIYEHTTLTRLVIQRFDEFESTARRMKLTTIIPSTAATGAMITILGTKIVPVSTLVAQRIATTEEKGDQCKARSFFYFKVLCSSPLPLPTPPWLVSVCSPSFRRVRASVRPSVSLSLGCVWSSACMCVYLCVCVKILRFQAIALTWLLLPLLLKP